MSNLARLPVAQKDSLPVSQAVRDAAKGEDCQLNLEGVCNHDPATTVFAHYRVFNVAGMAQKPPEPIGAFACSCCHDEIDRRGRAGSELWGYDDLLRGLIRTILILRRKGVLILK